MKVSTTAILFILVLVTSAITGYFIYKYKMLTYDPAQVAKQENLKTAAKVATLIDVPKDEEPSVASVTDKSKLGSQAFFSKVQNGDKVLIYNKAGLAVIYRPSIERVVMMTVMSTNSATPTGSATGTPTGSTTPTPSGTQGSTSIAPLRIAVYNGGSRSDLATTFRHTLTTTFPGSMITTGNAKKRTYTKNIVIKINASVSDDAVAKIATAVKGSVSTLPVGETKPNVDVLVIVAVQ